MRDPKRIEKILGQLRHIWMVYPDQRFFQLLCNMGFTHDKEWFYFEDDKLEEHLKNTIKEVG